MYIVSKYVVQMITTEQLNVCVCNIELYISYDKWQFRETQCLFKNSVKIVVSFVMCLYYEKVFNAKI